LTGGHCAEGVLSPPPPRCIYRAAAGFFLYPLPAHHLVPFCHTAAMHAFLPAYHATTPPQTFVRICIPPLAPFSYRCRLRHVQRRSTILAFYTAGRRALNKALCALFVRVETLLATGYLLTSQPSTYNPSLSPDDAPELSRRRRWRFLAAALHIAHHTIPFTNTRAARCFLPPACLPLPPAAPSTTATPLCLLPVCGRCPNILGMAWFVILHPTAATAGGRGRKTT